MKTIGLSLEQRQAIQTKWLLQCYVPVGLSSDITPGYDDRSSSRLDPYFEGWQATPGS